MAIRRLPSEERYSTNKIMEGGGIEPRRKLKKLRSVKVANLDRLRMSMRRTQFVPAAESSSSSSPILVREKTRFIIPGSSESESSSSPMSGRYSPSYMRPTSSSSARKASSKQGFDPIPAGVKRSNKLSSMKSMKIRAKYSQFPDVNNVNSSYDEDGMIKGEPKQKGLLERSLSRSRSIRLMRLKSVRSSRRQKSRLGGETTASGAENSNAKPHYMKPTTSQEARKDSETGSTRTSSLRPLRILAKIPSLRPKRSNARKPPDVSRVNIHRATCSSVLKTHKFPNQIQLESEKFSSLQVCPYTYCSLHGHQHHDPSPPLKEFVSAKRQLINKQRGKQFEDHSSEEVVQSIGVIEMNDLEQTVGIESPAANEVINARISNYQVEEDTDMEFLVNVDTKPRKKWELEGTPREQGEALSNSDYIEHNFGGYGWKLEDMLGGTPRPQAREEALTESKLAFTERNVKSSDKTQHQTIKFEESDLNVKLPDSGLKFSLADKTFEPFIDEAEIKSSLKNNSVSLSANSGADKSSLVDETLQPFMVEAEIQSSLKNHSLSLSTNSESISGDLANILSDKQKYSSIWHLIYQEFVPSEEPVSNDREIRGIGEIQRGDPSTDLELRESKHNPSLDKYEDNQGASSMDKTAFDQNDAINLVQKAVDAILEREGKKPGPKMSKNWNKLRKIIVTAKFIKAMEKLTKISPGKLRFLLPEAASEKERVYLRHLSMKERKYEEEWMLDFALRKVISRLAPDQQKRVGLLVEAFETFDPENKEKNVKRYPAKQETAPGVEFETSMDEEPKQIESKQGVSMSEEQAPKKQDDGLTVYLEVGDKILQEADETSIFSESPRSISATSIDRGFEEPSRGSEERMRTPQIAPKFQTCDLAVYPAGDMVMVLFDKQKYSSIWNMIYEHVVSSGTSTTVNQGIGGLGEKGKEYYVNDDLDSTPSSYSTDQEEDDDNSSVSGKKQELSKSATVKLVQEAVNGILRRYEPPSDQESIKCHSTASDNVKKIAIPTPTNPCEEDFGEGSKRSDKKNTHPEAKILETSDASQQQVEANESKVPPKKMSESLSRLRKAILTTKFIKAMEKLKKINPQKPRPLFPAAVSEEERVNLRHLSMDRRNSSEELMLDYALRKVITKLAPDQQRRVALLVEAYETVNPEQKEKGVRLANPANKEPKEFDGSEQQRSILDEQTLGKQDDGFLPSSEVIPKQRGLPEAHDHQVSEAVNLNNDVPDEKTRQETGKAVVSYSTLETTKNSSEHAFVDVTQEEPDIGGKALTTTREVSSQCGDSEVDTTGDISSILSDKTKYNSMWNLIYQHVVPRESSRDGKHGDNEVDENEQGEDAINVQQMKDPDATVRSESTNQKEKENNQSEAGKERELDQSEAIKLVSEAINTILQCSEPEDRLHKKVHENALSQKKVEGSGVEVSQRDSRKSFSRLKKLFITVKFMKAMERMRRISPQKLGYLSHEGASEEEKVSLRHQGINVRRNAEEWMLDYALRNVISSLPPEQQRRVALLVEAFHTITPEHKGTSSRSFMKAEVAPATEFGNTQSVKLTIHLEHDNSTSNEYNYHIHPNAGDKSSLLGEVVQLERSPIEDDPMEISNIKTNLNEEVLDSNSKGCPVDNPINRRETDSNSKSELLQEASLNEDSEQDREANITQGIFSDTQKHSSMWHLIYQHAKSVTEVEAVSSPREIVASKYQLESGNPSEMTVDRDVDDSDASSVTSELGENDAVKLVRETINDILAVPQELDNGLLFSNTEAASKEDQRAGGEEKTISSGYSKLKKLIICNKFIKAMEKAKMQKSYPQKWKNQILNSDPEAEKAILKCRAVGEAKERGELMLDHALQRVIEELAPVQQRRVALLVKAFEKVNPDIEDTGKSTESMSSASHGKGNRDQYQVLGDFDLKQQGSEITSSGEVATDSALEEIDRGDTPPICREDWGINGSSSVTDSVATSNVSKVPTDINSVDIPVFHIPQELTSIDVKYSEPPRKVVEKPSQPEDLLEDVGNPGTENDISVEKVRKTGLWCLLARHVKSDILDETETGTQRVGEISANGETHAAHELLGKEENYAGEVNHEEDENIQIPRTVSFEIQEKEAIKMVQEALDEILTCHDQSMTSNTGSDRDGSTESQGFREESSSVTDEPEGVQTLMDSVARPKKEQELEKEKLSNTYSQMSKVILCKRFIKAMDKMRELKAQTPIGHTQKLQSEEKIVHPMRQTASDHRKNWEEWMLDHAMQQVVGKLAPVQKKKVSLLVQAFEKVSSKPEPSSGKKVI